jgi:hypothetical protein
LWKHPTPTLPREGRERERAYVVAVSSIQSL